MSSPSILVAGIGNIFLGDDAFGVEVAQCLASRKLPDGVRVVDFGIRGLDLVYALLDPYDAVILVDAAPRGGRPGTLHALELDASPGEGNGEAALVEGHNLDPVKVLRLATAMGSPVRRLLLVGCEPQRCGDVEEMVDGLSDPVRAAVPEAVKLIETMVRELLRNGKEVVPCQP